MEIKWVPSPKYNAGGCKPVKIIDHWICGTLESCDSTFTTGSRQASAHYGVGPREIHQYVREGDRAWHCKGENYRSIGIEHEGWKGHAPERATLDLSAELHADIARRYGMGKLVWLENVFPHNHYADTDCPGTLDYKYIIEKANAINGCGDWSDMATKAEIEEAVWGHKINGKKASDLLALNGSTKDPTGRGMELNDHDHIKWIAATVVDLRDKVDALVEALGADTKIGGTE